MRSKVVRILALTFALSGVGMVMGQQPPQSGEEKQSPKQKKIHIETDFSFPVEKEKANPKKSNLESMLAEALKNNADIRVATAKLAEAEAELNRTRVQVTQQVVTLHHAILAQKATVDHEQKKFERMKTQSMQGSINTAYADEEFAKLTAAKAKLADLEAQVPGLLGKMSRDAEARVDVFSSLTLATLSNDDKILGLQAGTGELIIQHKQMGPIAEKIRKDLSRTISVAFANQSVTEIIESLSRDSGLVIKLRETSRVPVPEKLTFRCDNLTFGAVLQFLEDSLPSYTIVVRDYGLLITHRQNVPPGAISVQEFLRQKPAEK